MIVKIEIRMVPNQATDTEPAKHELTLSAIGNKQEIDWYEKQINGIVSKSILEAGGR